jgi:Protein of unknown function (DUF2786)
MTNGETLDELARQRMVARVRKVLALQDSPNENEAASAAQKAADLLLEYNLTMDDVRADINLEGLTWHVTETDSLPWRRTMGTMVAHLNLALYFYYFDKRNRPTSKDMEAYKRFDIHHFYGPEANAWVAKLTFEYLCEAVERMAAHGALTVRAAQRSAYLTSFKAAASNRLCLRIRSRLDEVKAQGITTEAGKNMLVPLNLFDDSAKKLSTALQTLTGDKSPIKITKQRVTKSNMQGALDGDAAGRAISLEKQVTGATEHRRVTKG